MEMLIDGLKTHYICLGEGQVIVLLHGWGADIQVYSNIINLVKNNYRIIALDMPGVGSSNEPHEAWDVDHYVDFVIKFLLNLNVDNIILIGHSFGCRVIIKLINRKVLPFAVSKIIIIDGAGIRAAPTLKKQVRTCIFKAGKAFCNVSLIKALIPNALNFWQKFFGSKDYVNATPIMRQTLVKVVNEDLTNLLPNVFPETLLIWGECDTATPLSDGQKMEKMMPNAGLAIIKGAGHFPFIDQPYVFNRILSSYLDLT